MPDLDVTDLLTDPDFCETVTIIRQSQKTDIMGINNVTPQTLTAYGSVQMGGLDVAIQTDEEHAQRLIVFYTKTRIFDITRAPVFDEPGVPAADTGGLTMDADGYLPDILQWNGNRYKVRRVEPWVNWGAGFFAVEAEMMNTTSSPGTA